MATSDTQKAPQANENDYVLRVVDLDADVLRVVSFDATEAISELFAYRIELSSENFNLDLSTIVGKNACLEMRIDEGTTRYVNGIVKSIEHSGFGTGRDGDRRLAYYVAELAPLHWLLSRRIRSRVFAPPRCSEMTVPGIIKKVFSDAGITDKSFRLALEKSYPTLDFVVQYGESDLAFISRLMEREGIFYFFEHDEEGCKMVIADSAVAHKPIAGEANIKFREATALVEDGHPIVAAREQQAVQIGSVMLDDYNFTKPSTQLRVTAQGQQKYALLLHEQPGAYLEREDGQRYAQVRLEREQCLKRIVRMLGTDKRHEAGFKFTLVENPRESLNIEYLMVRVRQRVRVNSTADQDAGGGNRQHTFEIDAIAADVPFRAARATAWPRIHGAQTAMVTGRSGEEIYTDPDGYGMIKVQFHWDQEGQFDENSSFWVRVSQPMAGGGYGAMFLPRVGQEVIVEFLDGDPDHPIVTGRVYNAENMPPYKLPDEKTKWTLKSRSTPDGGGFNELRFDDKKDSEQVFLHAQKELHVRTKKDQFEFTGGKKNVSVEGNLATKIGGSEGRSVGGDNLQSVGGKFSLSVKGDCAVGVSGNCAVGADGDLYLVGAKTGLYGDGYAEVSASNVLIEADSITIKSGGNFITIDGSGVSIVGSQVNINSGGSAGAAQSVTMASCSDPASPAEPVTGEPGKDVTHEQEAVEQDPLESAPLHRPEDAPEEKHWIGVRLLDDNGQPLVGERYVVKLPDGTTVARGFTDKEGKAEIKGIDPGSCEIQFPDLDGATWQPGEPTGGDGGGATSSSSSAATALV